MPQPIQNQIEERISHSDTSGLLELYGLHVPILEVIIRLFDESVWLLRDEMRRVEKVILHRIKTDIP